MAANTLGRRLATNALANAILGNIDIENTFGIDLEEEEFLFPTDNQDAAQVYTRQLQNQVPIIQFRMRAALPAQHQFTSIEEYLHTCYYYALSQVQTRYPNRFQGAELSGYAQMHVDVRDLQLHALQTEMAPLRDVPAAIDVVVYNIQQSKPDLVIGVFEDYQTITFTFILINPNQQIRAETVTAANRLFRSFQRPTTRGEIANLARFTYLENNMNRIRGGRRWTHLNRELQDVRNVASQNAITRRTDRPGVDFQRRNLAETLNMPLIPFQNARTMPWAIAPEGRAQRRGRDVLGGAPAPNAVIDQRRIRRRTNAEIQADLNNMAPAARAAEVRRMEQRRTYQQRAPLRGIYEEYRKRIFHHSSIEEFFQHTKAVLEVRNTHAQGHCMAMAFIRSQLRVTDTNTGFSEESQPVAYLPSIETPGIHRGIPVLPPYRTFFHENHPFVSDRNENGFYETIIMFNPYRSRKNATELKDALRYENIVSEAEEEAWYWAARNFHEFVVAWYREIWEDPTLDFDPNDEQTLQYYANIMQVVISLYRTDCQGQRVAIYIPEDWDRDLRLRDSIPVVSLLSNSEHVHAITHIRDFMQGKNTANRTHVDSYCVVCERVRSSNNATKQQCATHFKECLEKKKGDMKMKYRQELKYRDLTEYIPPMCRYNFKDKDYTCRICRQSLNGSITSQLEHVCLIQCSSNKMGAKENIFVYDFECCQEWDAALGHSRHRVNLVCCRRAYSDCEKGEERMLFHTLEEFMAYVMAKTEERRIYLAHNGGRYDVQFVMRYLERNMIYHDMVPTPSSMHAYLSVTIPFGKNKEAVFLDFRNFMPSSLRNIAISFQLPISKGDFPHYFNNGTNDHYVGRIPELHHEKDYWCVKSKRTQEEVDEFHEFYAEQCEIYCTCEDACTCSKQKWNFQEIITTYCWQDVDVLAEACVRYRDNAMSFGEEVDEEAEEAEKWVATSIDPFEYLTIPQVAVHLLLNGRPDETENERQQCLSITQSKLRTDRSPKGVIWLERLMQHSTQLHIKHIGNSNREFYCFATKRYLDGYDGTKVYVCLDCQFHACKDCYFEEFETGVDHPTRPATFAMVNRTTKDFLITLMNTYGQENVQVVWDHQVTNPDLYELRLADIMRERDMFYGGRTEVFSPFVNGTHFPDYELKYLDVCSLYPYVCAFKVLPTGNPTHIFGRQVDRDRVLNPNHPDPYFGYVRCFVVPNRQCLLGLLPKRDPKTGRLEFPLEPMEGSWGTQELQLAIENGYEVRDIYEVYHFDADNRSDTLLRGYVSFFLRMKQEAEGWKKLGATCDEPSEDEKKHIQQKMFLENGGIAKVRLDQVRKDPVRRQMAKIYLNSLWGKFCQKPNRTFYRTVRSYKEFCEIWFDRTIERSSFQFRHLGGDTWKVKYEVKQDYNEPNAKYNIYLASKVTEWARCILHRQMLHIGAERICYCDTDSLIFLRRLDETPLTGCGLGKWVDEYPRDKIVQLYALAPKFYFLVFSDGKTSLKSKGIQMTLENFQKLHARSLGSQLLELFFPQLGEDGLVKPFGGYLTMGNMLIGVNTVNSKEAYGAMLTRYTQPKRVRPVFMKRLFVPYMHQINVQYDNSVLSQIPRIITIPHGYFETSLSIGLRLYRDLQLPTNPHPQEEDEMSM